MGGVHDKNIHNHWEGFDQASRFERHGLTCVDVRLGLLALVLILLFIGVSLSLISAIVKTNFRVIKFLRGDATHLGHFDKDLANSRSMLADARGTQ